MTRLMPAKLLTLGGLASLSVGWTEWWVAVGQDGTGVAQSRFGGGGGWSRERPVGNCDRGAAKITSLSWKSLAPIRDSCLAARCVAVTTSLKRNPPYFINCGWICRRPIEPPLTELLNLPSRSCTA